MNHPQELMREETREPSTVQTCKRIECQKNSTPAIVRSIQIKYEDYYRIVGECVNCGTFQKRFFFMQNLSGLKSLLPYPHVRLIQLEEPLSRFKDLIVALHG